MPVHSFHAVRGPQAAEAVPLDYARKAAPFAGARHVDVLDPVEHGDRESLPLGDIGRSGLPDLANKSLRLGVDLLRMPALGHGGALPLLVAKAKLDGVVSVAVFGSDLEHGARTAFQNGNRDGGSVFLVESGSCRPCAKKPHLHRLTPST